MWNRPTYMDKKSIKKRRRTNLVRWTVLLLGCACLLRSDQSVQPDA